MNIIKMNYDSLRRLILQSVDMVIEPESTNVVFKTFEKNSHWFRQVEILMSGFHHIKIVSRRKNNLTNEEKKEKLRKNWLDMTRYFVLFEEYDIKAEKALTEFIRISLDLGIGRADELY